VEGKKRNDVLEADFEKSIVLPRSWSQSIWFVYKSAEELGGTRQPFENTKERRVE